MYAIVFDLDTNTLKDVYPGPSGNNAYNEVRSFLAARGFDWQQRSTYFGNDTVDAVTCVLAVQDMAQKLEWFAVSVRDIGMLRIEENNDLIPAVARRSIQPSKAN